jgi:hypothetical protein
MRRVSAASNPIHLLQADLFGIGVCVGCEDLRWRQSFGLLCLGVTAAFLSNDGERNDG